MIVETMSENEKIKYLSDVEYNINTIVERIVFRSCSHKKKGQWINLGTRTVVIKDNRYYYSIKAQRMNRGRGTIGFNIEFIPYTILSRNNGKRYVLSFDTLKTKKCLRIFELHVFERYRERFLKNYDISLADSIKIFFERNNFGTITLGKKGYAKIIDDGVLLCDDDVETLKSNSLHWKTFITEELLKEDQNYLSKYGILWGHIDKLISKVNADSKHGTQLLNQYLNDCYDVRKYLGEEV